MTALSPPVLRALFSRSYDSPGFRVRVSLLALLGLFALTQAGKVRRAALLEGVVRSDAPDPALVHEVLRESGNRSEVLHRVWNTGRLPQRWEVMNFLNHRIGTDPDLRNAAAGLLEEAATDADLSVRHAAWSLLRISGHPAWQETVRGGLADPDAVTREFARTVLAAGGVTNAAPMPEPLMEAGGPAFGHLMFHDFKHMPVALSNHVNRPVLLHFFATWSPECGKEVDSLIQLRTEVGDSLLMLGVALDALPGVRHDHGPGEQHVHLEPGRDDEAIVKAVERHVITRKYNFPVVFDLDGIATAQLEGSELPVHVLLDSRHRLVRRYTGARDATNHAVIVRTLLGLKPDQAPAAANSLAK